MAKNGPIIVVDDDADDQEILQEILKDLGIDNKLIFFIKGPDAFQYLKTTTDRPFIIFSDVNLPQQNGIEFKRQIDNDHQLRQKSIPFVFLSTFFDKKTVDTVYQELTIQGVFRKNNSYEELKGTIKLIVDYWKVCKHPNE